jgi:hypothetical protein
LSGAGRATINGGGRFHFYVTAIGMTCGFVPSLPGAGRSAVFWQGDGGWVIAPPSRHLSGQAGRWVQPLETPLPEAHLVLRELLDVQDQLAHPATRRPASEPWIGALRSLPRAGAAGS